MTLSGKTVLVTAATGSRERVSLHGPCASPDHSAKRLSASWHAVFAQSVHGQGAHAFAVAQGGMAPC